jgi:hypothetical protein
MICFTIPHRLSIAGFTQGSFYARNVLVQPGPLTHPLDQRSLKTLSFRVVDFGRCQSWSDLFSEGRGDMDPSGRDDKAAIEERTELKFTKLFSKERQMAKDTILGQRRIWRQGFDKLCHGG